MNELGNRELKFPILFFLLIVAIMMVSVGFLYAMPMVPIIVCGFLVIFYGKLHKVKLDNMMPEMIDLMGKLFIVVIIVLQIGMIISSFMAAGTIPAIIYYGVKIISPKWFLVTAFILCSFVAMLVSSWSTIGTIGIAMMGIGTALDIPPAMTAGAVLGAALFGDKQSPLAQSTNFAAAISGTTLYKHTKAMLNTTFPVFIISVIAFIILGLKVGGNASTVNKDAINDLLNVTSEIFHINALCLLPVVLLIVLIVMKVNPIFCMMAAWVSATVIAVLFQGTPISSVFDLLQYGYECPSDNETAATLYAGGGMSSMGTMMTLLGSIAFLGGAINAVGLFDVIMKKLLGDNPSKTRLMFASMFSTLALAITTADINFPYAAVGTAFGPEYEKQGLERYYLSRTMEDFGIFTPVLPWDATAVMAMTLLGVGAAEYWPYAFMCYLTPICSMILRHHHYIKVKD